VRRWLTELAARWIAICCGADFVKIDENPEKE
jgi:hypothetical protein